MSRLVLEKNAKAIRVYHARYQAIQRFQCMTSLHAVHQSPVTDWLRKNNTYSSL